MNKRFIRRLARRLRKLALGEYNQGTWAEKFGLKPACKTAACIAGHAVIMGGYNLRYEKGQQTTSHCGLPGQKRTDIETAAAKLLGIGKSFCEDLSFDLFTSWPPGVWPEPYGTRYRDAQDSIQRANVAADLLEAIADERVK